MKSSNSNYIDIRLSPKGFIEQTYVGSQTPQDVINAIKQIEKFAKELEKTGKPVLLLIDLRKITNIDLSKKALAARAKGIKAMKSVNYVRAAICGSLTMQITVNTLALVAGVSNKVKVFDKHADAVRWLIRK